MPPSLQPAYLTQPIPHAKQLNPEDEGSMSKMLVSTHKATQYHSPEGHNLNFKTCIGSLTRIGMERFQFLYANICHK
jgi:hypothetical protein